MNRTPANAPIREEIRKKLLVFQRNELTEYYIYSLLAAKAKNEENRKLLKEIAGDELAHHDFYRGLTQESLNPQRWRVFLFYWAARIFGLTFMLKLMEMGEERAKNAYEEIYAELPEVRKIAEDEDRHVDELLNLISEEHLNYVGSVVLGLNDALVELTALWPANFRPSRHRLIALAGLITGVAACFPWAPRVPLHQDGGAVSRTPLNPPCTPGPLISSPWPP